MCVGGGGGGGIGVIICGTVRQWSYASDVVSKPIKVHGVTFQVLRQ